MTEGVRTGTSVVSCATTVVRVYSDLGSEVM